MDRNIRAMNNLLTQINIHLEFSEAFDSIDPNILDSKVKYYEVQGMSLNSLKQFIMSKPICRYLSLKLQTLYS